MKGVEERKRERERLRGRERVREWREEKGRVKRASGSTYNNSNAPIWKATFIEVSNTRLLNYYSTIIKLKKEKCEN